MIKGVTHAHFGQIWYHSEPADVPYSPNQFLGLDFFYSFLQQTPNLCLALDFFATSYSKIALIPNHQIWVFTSIVCLFILILVFDKNNLIWFNKSVKIQDSILDPVSKILDKYYNRNSFTIQARCMKNENLLWRGILTLPKLLFIELSDISLISTQNNWNSSLYKSERNSPNCVSLRNCNIKA